MEKTDAIDIGSSEALEAPTVQCRGNRSRGPSDTIGDPSKHLLCLWAACTCCTNWSVLL